MAEILRNRANERGMARAMSHCSEGDELVPTSARAPELEIRIETGMITSPAWGWSVLSTMSPTTSPGAVPGGTVTVRRYRPFTPGESSGATTTFSRSGAEITSNRVSLPPRTIRLRSRDTPSRVVMSCILNPGGTTPIGPITLPPTVSLTSGSLG